VVGHHVRGHADSALPGAGAQVIHGLDSAQLPGDVIRVQRIRRSDGVRVTSDLLDALRGFGTLPNPNQPKPGEPALRDEIKFFVRNLIQPVDVAAVLLGKLVQPDVGVLGQEHGARHPLAVRREGFELVHAHLVIGHQGGARTEKYRLLLLADQVQMQQQAGLIRRDQIAPLRHNEAQLVFDRVGEATDRQKESLQQTQVLWAKVRQSFEVLIQCEKGLVVWAVRFRRIPAQHFVVEEFANIGQRRIFVDQPETQHVLQRHRPARPSGWRSELLQECRHQLVHRGRTEIFIQEPRSGGQRGRLNFLDVDRDHVGNDLIKEPRGRKAAGPDGEFRVTFQVARRIHLVGKRASPGKIRKIEIKEHISLASRAREREWNWG